VISSDLVKVGLADLADMSETVVMSPVLPRITVGRKGKVWILPGQLDAIANRKASHKPGLAKPEAPSRAMEA
jgi:hypothetical protein